MVLKIMSFIRYKVTHEYDGTSYHGWQRQHALPTVQDALEAALQRFAPQASPLYVSGRTDAGVHALRQVAHFDLPIHRAMDPFRVQQAFNAHLVPHPIVVHGIEIAPEGFHARFSAIQRAYRYCIINRRAPLGLDRHRAWWVVPHLNVDRMQEACQLFIGTIDFSTFRSTECQAQSPMRTVDEAWLQRDGVDGIQFYVRARSFLHHQIRNMVGGLKYVGEGRWSVDQLKQALHARNRRQGAVMAPPQGLYLEYIMYS